MSRYMNDVIGVPTGAKVDRANHPNRRPKRPNVPSTGSVVNIPRVGPARVTESGRRYFKSETLSSRRPIKETGVGIVRDEGLY